MWLGGCFLFFCFFLALRNKFNFLLCSNIMWNNYVYICWHKGGCINLFLYLFQTSNFARILVFQTVSLHIFWMKKICFYIYSKHSSVRENLSFSHCFTPNLLNEEFFFLYLFKTSKFARILVFPTVIVWMKKICFIFIPNIQVCEKNFSFSNCFTKNLLNEEWRKKYFYLFQNNQVFEYFSFSSAV